ncbi:MAG: DUF423 domain-containing protein [Steroidobacteraceae bacterium]
MNSRRTLAVAGLLLALGMVLGAIGMHALRGRLQPEQWLQYQTALHYQFYQAPALLGVGLALRLLDVRLLRLAAALLAAGIVAFCGSLYALALGAPRALGALAPVGGYVLVAGWLVFAFGVWRHWEVKQ